MHKPVVVSEAKRNLSLPLVKANPPPWLPILEELLNLANIDACVKDAKFHPRANTILPVVSCGKKHLACSETVDSEVPS
jgi:hypothetical protein